MDDAHSLPTDLAECHGLLVAAYQQTVQLERRATESEQRLSESEQQAADLTRVLDETAASYQELQQEHAAQLSCRETRRLGRYARKMKMRGILIVTV